MKKFFSLGILLTAAFTIALFAVTLNRAMAGSFVARTEYALRLVNPTGGPPVSNCSGSQQCIYIDTTATPNLIYRDGTNVNKVQACIPTTTGDYCSYNSATGNFQRSGAPAAQQRHAVADANYSTSTSDTIVGYTSITAARTVTATTGGTSTIPIILMVTDESGSASPSLTITLAPSSGTIDGVASKVVVHDANGWWQGYSNGTNWFTTASSAPPTVSAPTLLNSWTNFGGGFMAAGYWKQNGTVCLRGMVHNGTTAVSVIFTLPVGYRPSATLYFSGAASGAAATIYEVDTTGTVEAALGGSTTYEVLNGICFLAEQ